MRGNPDGSDAPGGSNGSLRRLARHVAVIGAAAVVILVFMAFFTRPVESPPPRSIGTSEWTLVSAPYECQASDEGGYTYSAQLINHSRVARDFRLGVAFEVDGHRHATGAALIQRVGPGSSARVEISVPASFPESLPEVRCGVEVRHAPAA